MLKVSPLNFAISAFALLFIYFIPDLYQDLRVHYSHEETRCTVLAKKVYEGMRYWPKVQVSYNANNINYISWSPASRIHPVTMMNWYANQLLKRYQINSQIACWYDSFDPKQIVLESNYHMSKLFVLLGGLLLLMDVFILCRLCKGTSETPINKITVQMILTYIGESSKKPIPNINSWRLFLFILFIGLIMFNGGFIFDKLSQVYGSYPDVQLLNTKSLATNNHGLETSSHSPNMQKSTGYAISKITQDFNCRMHFLLGLDIGWVLTQRVEGKLKSITNALRREHIRYTGHDHKADNQINITFHTKDAFESAYIFVQSHYKDFLWQKLSGKNGSDFNLQGMLSSSSNLEAHKEILDQAIGAIRYRLTKLGILDFVVQQQGDSHVSVEIPGNKNADEAKNILVKSGTLEFHIVDPGNGAASHLQGDIVSSDTFIVNTAQGQPVILKRESVLDGSSIVSATSGIDADGRANIQVRLSGAGESLFTKTTSENIGKPMAVLYAEIISIPKIENGKKIMSYTKQYRIINIATIQSPLGGNFQITGLSSYEETRILAMLLSAGSLLAPVTIIEERQLGANCVPNTNH